VLERGGYPSRSDGETEYSIYGRLSRQFRTSRMGARPRREHRRRPTYRHGSQAQKFMLYQGLKVTSSYVDCGVETSDQGNAYTMRKTIYGVPPDNLDCWGHFSTHCPCTRGCKPSHDMETLVSGSAGLHFGHHTHKNLLQPWSLVKTSRMQHA